MENNELQQRRAETQALLEDAECLFTSEECHAALLQMAHEITDALKDSYPLVLPVMGGAIVFAGRLLPLLNFPLDFDYIHISRYSNKLSGGGFQWLRMPKDEVKGRDILVLDDILDEGHTMAAICEHMLNFGAKSCRAAVFANKILDRDKPIQADFIGLEVPNHYVFGYGMDAKGVWRNLDGIYALHERHY